MWTLPFNAPGRAASPFLLRDIFRQGPNKNTSRWNSIQADTAKCSCAFQTDAEATNIGARITSMLPDDPRRGRAHPHECTGLNDQCIKAKTICSILLDARRADLGSTERQDI